MAAVTRFEASNKFCFPLEIPFFLGIVLVDFYYSINIRGNYSMRQCARIQNQQESQNFVSIGDSARVDVKGNDQMPELSMRFTRDKFDPIEFSELK